MVASAIGFANSLRQLLSCVCLFVCCDFVQKDFDGAALAPVESINVLQMESTLIQLE
jgi:hypothetical protein